LEIGRRLLDCRLKRIMRARRVLESGEMIATVRDGTRLNYHLVSGKKSGRFVLVHSLAMDSTFWAPVAEYLREEGDVLLYDCRGHGQSDKPAGPYSVELFADDLSDLLAKVGWSKAIVAGASMGGCVTLAFASAYPEKIGGLGLVDTTAWYGEKAKTDWEVRAQKAVAEGLSSLVEFQSTRWFSDGFRRDHAEILDESIKVFLANDVRAYAETCRMLGSCDMRAALPRINAKTRIAVGAEDYATPIAMAEAMAAAIPGATFEVIPGVRHLTPLECPDKIARVLASLVGEK
jgi:3-oxoadipate enol-lactonase